MSSVERQQRSAFRAARSVGLLVLLIAVVTAGAPGVIHIRRGDTLSSIALRHHTTVAKLQRANHLHGTRIYAGALLRIPGNATPPPRRRLVTSSYRVHAGDTLTGVARKLHTSNAVLIRQNRLHTTTIYIGQRLVYAAAAAPTRATNAGRPISTRVGRSAAWHRRVLRQRSLPSRQTVRALIRASARRHHVPTSLALALAYQESGFQQRVVSPVDAIGVMQVLPSTGRSLGYMHGRGYDLLKTTDNIEAGVTLLRDLLDATGTAPRAMAGYYQGLGSLRRIGLLPQTRAYIKNITLLQRRFR